MNSEGTQWKQERLRRRRERERDARARETVEQIEARLPWPDAGKGTEHGVVKKE